MEGLDENLDVRRVAEISRVNERGVESRGGVDENGTARERVLNGSLDRDSLDGVSVSSICTGVTQQYLGLSDRRGEDVVQLSLVPSGVSSANLGVGAVGVDLGGLLGGDLVDEGLSVVGAEERGEVDVGDALELKSEPTSSKREEGKHSRMVGRVVETGGVKSLPKRLLSGGVGRVGLNSISSVLDAGGVERELSRKVVGEVHADSRELVGDVDAERAEVVAGSDTGQLEKLC